MIQTLLKYFPPFHQDQFNSEQLVLKHLEAKLSVKTPRIQHIGDIAGWPYIMMTRLRRDTFRNTLGKLRSL